MNRTIWEIAAPEGSLLPFTEARARVLQAFREMYVAEALKAAPSVSAAARRSGLDRSNFKRQMRKAGLRALCRCASEAA